MAAPPTLSIGEDAMKRKKRLPVYKKRALPWCVRLVRDLFDYLEPLIDRVGLRNGSISAARHNGQMTQPQVLVKPHTYGLTGNSTKLCRSANDLHEINDLFRVRLNRLFHHLTFDYGSVEINVHKGAIIDLTFTVSARSDERDTIGSFFSCHDCGPSPCVAASRVGT
jgi:hypothetical protein